ncbi:MAG: response regulator [Gammaproteobacteria bacterium]|nr:response regulator [Gammaproteobacteria bacterium]
MNSRVLLVESSATMRYVLENYLLSLGYDVSAVDNYAAGFSNLVDQFKSYDSDFDAVVLGWPTVAEDSASELSSKLEEPDYSELPVIVMSTDMRAETRAWVAGRENTALLAWKEFEGVKALLSNLLVDPSGQDGSVSVVKFDNSDVRLLVVDDSASIRLALKELLELHGYSVSLCADSLSALSTARESEFDIAIVDFYLGEDTGDNVCRSLINDPQTGDVTCTILTSTYSDHIIKRCLRAGAVECMFKNESSELLLARIDAISRLIRQRKQLEQEQARLELLIDTMAGATLVLRSDGTIGYASQQAIQELGFENRQSLLGRRADAVLDPEVLQLKPGGKKTSSWLDANEQTVDVSYEQSRIGDSEEIIIQFSRIDHSESGVDVQDGLSTDAIISQLELSDTAAAFIEQLKTYQRELADLPEMVSLLVIDVRLDDVEFSQDSAEAIAVMDRVNDTVMGVYKRENHVAQIKPARYGFLLRHVEEAQAYLLTRKIMQIVKEIDTANERSRIVCLGSLLSLNKNQQLAPVRILDRARQGLQIVDARGVDQALLIDLRRMLPVYPRS